MLDRAARLCLPEARRYSRLCRLLHSGADDIAFLIFSPGDMRQVQDDLVRKLHKAAEQLRTFQIEAWADGQLFSALLVTGVQESHRRLVQSASESESANVLFPDSFPPSVRSLDQLFAQWQDEAGCKFDIVESAVCGGISLTHWTWDIAGLLTDLEGNSVKDMFMQKPHLLRTP